MLNVAPHRKHKSSIFFLAGEWWSLVFIAPTWKAAAVESIESVLLESSFSLLWDQNHIMAMFFNLRSSFKDF